ncbi:MAG: ISL3 family transposase [Phycisphaerales bacterium]|nr:ISL3 family transposase [Phycisphaerales bacterium]
MRDRDLHAQIHGIAAPWHVTDVRLDVPAGTVEVIVEHRGDACCPKCGKPCPGYDTRLRRWRQLDTCQLQTLLVADVLGVECEEHGVVQAATPWSEPGSRFTALFKRKVIDWLREAHFSAVARHLGDAVNTVRKAEHKRLRADGDRILVGTKHLWLESPASMRPERRSMLSQLKGICTRTGRAWALKELAAKLWDYVSPDWARRAWTAWAALASRSRLEPMVPAARMVRTHREPFRNAILFHLGGLHLYPRPASAHTVS